MKWSKFPTVIPYDKETRKCLKRRRASNELNSFFALISNYYKMWFWCSFHQFSTYPITSKQQFSIYLYSKSGLFLTTVEHSPEQKNFGNSPPLEYALIKNETHTYKTMNFVFSLLINSLYPCCRCWHGMDLPQNQWPDSSLYEKKCLV